ncbi:MAG: hypothetical protein JWP01_1909 [Myxococcales bacterium]|nr:hypothetical protein [Myxococcales bacterium]
MIQLPALQRFVVPRRAETTGELCELCGGEVPASHRHVVDLERQALQCVCHACAILFDRTSSSTGRFRTVPDRITMDKNLAMTSSEWSALGVPVGLAFVFHSTRLGRPVLCYPGPAGVTEAEAPPGVWEALLAASPAAATLEPDVEALLIRGERGAPHLQSFVIPIDAAYALAGRLRVCWRGFTGGDEAQRELDAFFAEITERAR